MSWATSEAVAVLTFLLPGFVGAAVFYALTSHPRPGEFARVVQALVFTTLGQAAAGTARWLAALRWPGYEWPAGLELAVSVASAMIIALLAAALSNHDTVHRLLRWAKITRETSYPSEWYSAFAEHPGCYVVLYLKGNRRLSGWPMEWPSGSAEGHFRIGEPVWLDGGSQDRDMTEAVAVLVPASDVEMVQFLATPTTGTQE